MAPGTEYTLYFSERLLLAIEQNTEYGKTEDPFNDIHSVGRLQT